MDCRKVFSLICKGLLSCLCVIYGIILICVPIYLFFIMLQKDTEVPDFRDPDWEHITYAPYDATTTTWHPDGPPREPP